jgi:hypothetical protein
MPMLRPAALDAIELLGVVRKRQLSKGGVR